MVVNKYSSICFVLSRERRVGCFMNEKAKYSSHFAGKKCGIFTFFMNGHIFLSSRISCCWLKITRAIA
jgi:hypothetical protein